MTTTPASSVHRYERKFLIEELDMRQVQAVIKLHPAMFRQAYPPRYVNNIYLDGVTLENYHDNLAGAADRLKVRIRWYGDFFGQVQQPVLEFKVKNGYVGTKEQIPFAPFAMDEQFCGTAFDALICTSPFLSNEVRARLIDQHVTLLSSYRREYYDTFDGHFRLTLDSDLTFYRCGRLDSHFLHPRTEHRLLIVELKYQPEHDLAAQHIASVFPFRVTRSSKYIQGVESVYI